MSKQDTSLHDTGIGWAILLIVFAVLLWLFWYFYNVEVRDLVRWIRYGEMWLVSWFLGPDHTVTFGDQAVSWWRGFADAPRWTPSELGYQHLSYFTSLAMQPYEMPIVLALGLMAAWCMFYGPGTNFRRKLDLESLIERQAENFHVIAPFVQFNPCNQPPRPPGTPVPAELPLFAEALGPEEWMAYHAIPVPDGHIDEAAATAAFQKQLIGRWRGPLALKPYQQILMAAFILKSARKRKESDDMLGRLARCWSAKGGLRLGRDGKLLREAQRILRDEKLSGKALTQINRHAFVTTAMLRALAFAREEGGVLAPAQFLWLRGHDRTLWYPLNNLGRQSFHMEAMGAMSHYKAERMTQRPIPMPKMENALTTIKEYMSSGRVRPIPQLDYSGSKKSGIKQAK